MEIAKIEEQTHVSLTVSVSDVILAQEAVATAVADETLHDPRSQRERDHKANLALASQLLARLLSSCRAEMIEAAHSKNVA